MTVNRDTHTHMLSVQRTLNAEPDSDYYFTAGRYAAVAAEQQLGVRHLHGVPGVLMGVLLVDGPEQLRTVAATVGQLIGWTRIVVPIDVLANVHTALGHIIL